MVLAMVVVRTGSLWSAFLGHVAFDTISLSLIPLLQGVLKEAIEQPAGAPAG